MGCVAGADELDAGAGAVLGRPFVESDAVVRRMVAALLDDVDHFPTDVVEHLRLIAWLHGSDAATEAAVSDVGLDDVRHQLPPTLYRLAGRSPPV